MKNLDNNIRRSEMEKKYLTGERRKQDTEAEDVGSHWTDNSCTPVAALFVMPKSGVNDNDDFHRRIKGSLYK